MSHMEEGLIKNSIMKVIKKYLGVSIKGIGEKTIQRSIKKSGRINTRDWEHNWPSAK